MAVSLTHFGEALIERMANDRRGEFLDLCNLRGEADTEFVKSGERLAHRELQLLPYGGVGFDGASRVDLVVQLSRDRATPFEVKLGTTRLSKSRIDDEWLCGCGVSHLGRRFTGNMMSILERKFPQGVALDKLRVRLSQGVPLELTSTWIVIARNSVLKRWLEQGRPAFSDRVRLRSFESVVDSFGGKDRFNALVQEMLSFDYFEEWVNRGNE